MEPPPVLVLPMMREPLNHYILPQLDAEDLAKLACTCKALRDCLYGADAALWVRAASTALPQSSVTCGNRAEAQHLLARYASAGQNLRRGLFTAVPVAHCLSNTNTAAPALATSPDGRNVAYLNRSSEDWYLHIYFDGISASARCKLPQVCQIYDFGWTADGENIRLVHQHPWNGMAYICMNVAIVSHDLIVTESSLDLPYPVANINVVDTRQYAGPAHPVPHPMGCVPSSRIACCHLSPGCQHAAIIHTEMAVLHPTSSKKYMSIVEVKNGHVCFGRLVLSGRSCWDSSGMQFAAMCQAPPSRLPQLHIFDLLSNAVTVVPEASGLMTSPQLFAGSGSVMCTQIDPSQPHQRLVAFSPAESVLLPRCIIGIATISPDSTRACTPVQGSEALQVVAVSNGQQLSVLQAPYMRLVSAVVIKRAVLAWSPDGKYILWAGSSVVLFDAGQGSLLMTLVNAVPQPSPIVQWAADCCSLTVLMQDLAVRDRQKLARFEFAF